MHKEFWETAQRPYPLPTEPWAMTQVWDHLLFCHWPVPVEILREHVPTILNIDLFEGQAWIGIIPFEVNNMRVRGMPKIPLLNSYLELNVRTYVTYKNTPGVYFFSLDVDKLQMVLAAKIGSLLPYRKAIMELDVKDDHTCFRSNLDDVEKEHFALRYRALTEPYLPDETSLHYWLFERYCFFLVKYKNLYRGDIHHDRWRVSGAEVDIQSNSMAAFLPRKYLEPKPLAHLSMKKQVFGWKLKKLF